MAGLDWINDTKKFVDARGDMPHITPAWTQIMFELKRQISNWCPHCGPSLILCDKHDYIFDWLIRLAKANIPIRYWPLEIEGSIIKNSEAYKTVNFSIENIDEIISRGLGLSVFGTKGVGKTTLTVYFLKEALRKGYSGYFSLMESLLTLVKDSFDDTSAKEKLETIKNINVLVLDDIGKEYDSGSGFVDARLDELFRWRDSMRLSTLFSSNLSGVEFRKRYGPGIISLMKNTNKAIALDGDELRPRLNEWDEICPKQ